MIKELTMEKAILPDGWEIKPLGEISDVRDGTHDSPKYQEDGFPLITSKNLKNGQIVNDKIKFISNADYLHINKRSKVDIGDILFAMIGTIGNPVIITEEPVFAIKNVALFKQSEILTSAFLKYYLDSSYVVDKMQKEAKGATQKFVGLGYLRKFPVSYPKLLPQQKQIVAILDKAFAAIATAKANAEQNLQNAAALFESYLQNVFENKGDDWEEKSLGKVTSKIGSGATPRGGKANYKEVGISLIRSMNVHDFYFKEKNLAFIDEKQADALSNVTIQEEDVLLNITGASIARCCIVPKECLPARVNQHVSIIRANKEIINPVFLASLLTSKFFKDQILEIGEQGATRQAITKVQLENFKISFPKMLKEQQNVIENINAIKTQSKKLEVIYTQKIADLEELKKSVLQKAFSGQLTNSELPNL